MSDDLTPPHRGASEEVISITDNVISALIERIEAHNDVPVSEIVATIAAIQARLAAAGKMADALGDLLELRAVWTDPHNDSAAAKARAARAAWEAAP